MSGATDPNTSIEALAGSVRDGQLSARELVAARLETIEASQEVLNAFTLIDGDRALAAAADVDARVAAGEDPGPLAGVPVAVKDLIDHEGRPNTRGGSFEVEPARETAPSVAALEAAGAVIVGRTGLHEFAYGFSSENHWYGPVRNPWDTDLSPGGSSGGSAAAVAAGLVPAALGTDTGGSVRVPAALCGIVGLKVTQGRVSIRGVFPLAASVDTVGPLARSVADAALIYSIIAGDDPGDAWAAPHRVVPMGEPADLATITIGVPRGWIEDGPVTAEIRTAFGAALDAYSDAGARIVDIDVAELRSALPEASYAFEVAALHRDRFEADPERYGPEVRGRLAKSMEATGEAYLAALEWRSRLTHGLERALAGVDVLATPATAALHKVIGERRIDIDGDGVDYRAALSYFSAKVNHARLPAIALPLDAGGAPPPGLQLIGAAWQEHRLLEIAAGSEIAGIVATRQPQHWYG